MHGLVTVDPVLGQNLQRVSRDTTTGVPILIRGVQTITLATHPEPMMIALFYYQSRLRIITAVLSKGCWIIIPINDL
ncbi:hypothetical protein D3C76_1253280 [compost metagenome]